MNHTEQLKALDDARWRIAIALTVAMMVLYFGFILLVAYAKPLLGRLVAPGLSLGMLLGALVIVAAWVLIWIYVRWANTHYDAALDAVRDRAARHVFFSSSSVAAEVLAAGVHTRGILQRGGSARSADALAGAGGL